MKKVKVLLSMFLSAVLLFGGILSSMEPSMNNVEAAEEGTSQIVKLKVTENDADITFQRVDDKDATLYRTMVKENLPQNAVIRLNLTNNDDSYVIKNLVVDGQSYLLENITEELEVGNGSVIKLVYEPTVSAYDSFDVTYYDYDYSSPTGNGINNESNYPAGSSESQRLQVGVTDDFHANIKANEYSPVAYGSALGETNYIVPMLLHRPAIGAEPEATTDKGLVNWNNGADVGDGTLGIDGVFWPIVENLALGLDANGNPVWGKNNNGEQIVDPGFFTSEAKLGKHIYTRDNLPGGASLDYEREGYHYVLKRANVNGVYTNIKVDNGGTEISNPRFFPLDSLTDDSQKFIDPWHSLPETVEDYNAHNWYFGIRQEFTFAVGEYDGPLEYVFEGDDDLWVFLDGERVLDLGGIHSAYPSGYVANTVETAWKNTVDIKSIIQEKDPDTWREKEYKITILYMERGGYDSNCYMAFTLPMKAASALSVVIDIPSEVEFTGMDDAVADGNFDPENDVVTVYLIDKATINDENPTVIKTLTTSAAEGWKANFSEVDLDAGIEYAVIGDQIPDFKSSGVTGNVSDGFKLAYEYSPEMMSLNVQKVWDASVIATGNDTDSVEVKLLADGVQYGENLTITEAEGWTKTIDNLQVRKNKTAINYTVEEVNMPAGIISSISGSAATGYVITNNMEHQVKYTFVKKDASMPDMPDTVTNMLPLASKAMGGTVVTAEHPAVNTKVELPEGTWTFEGYDEDSKTVLGETTFVGTWSYEAKPVYDVTYSFVSGTADKVLPTAVTALIPTVTTAIGGSTVNAQQPAQTSVDVGDGVWEFVSYNTDSVVVDGDVNFEGVWKYTEKTVYDVTHAFVSGTAGMELPAAVTALVPAATTAKEGDVVAPTAPAQILYEVGTDGYWTFAGYDKTNVEVTGDVDFVGTWNYVPNPVQDVTYTFVSGTDGKTLPDEVLALKPYDTVVTVGTTVSPTEPLVDSVKVADGTWTFDSYDKDSVLVNDEDVNFTGTWNFTPTPEYQVTYKFVSGTDGVPLPLGIMDHLPERKTVKEGTTVTAEQPTTTVVETPDGYWEFDRYDKDSAVVNSDVEFTGTWTYTAKNIYNVTHTFVSGMVGKDLPTEVLALTPTNKTATEGATVVPTAPSQTSVEVEGGTWTFDSYDKDSAVANADVNFKGTWNFVPTPTHQVTYSFVSGTTGKELPAEVLSYLPEGKTVYEGTNVTAEQPTTTTVETADGYWRFEEYDKETAVANTDVQFTGTWTYTEKKIYDVIHIFVSGTAGKELPNEVLALKPADNTAKEGATVKATAPAQQSVKVADGTWNFVSYDKENAVVNADVDFTGTWTFVPTPEYQVTYNFVSGTAGKDLPLGIMDYLPEAKTVKEGTNVTAEQPTDIVVETPDGYWEFKQYDKNSAVVNSDVQFTGTWTYTEKNVYKVTHTYVSGTEGKTLPAEVLALEPADFSAIEKTTATAKMPAKTSVDVEGGTWKFVSYDKESEVVTSDVDFKGTWKFVARVTYNFVSGTEGKELPEEILKYLPDGKTVDNGTTVNATTPSTTTVKTADGYWVFEKYDKDTAVVTSDVNFEGTWKFVATYDVSYGFVSGTAGKTLPAEVLAVLPKSVEDLENNTVVTPAQPAKTSIDVADGTWKFVSWDKSQLTINGGNGAFIGKWFFTAKSNPPANNNNNNNVKTTNTSNPVAPKTGENAWPGTWMVVTMFIVPGVLLLRKRKEQ